MWTTASGISENRLCLAGCKFIDVLKNWLSVSIKGIHSSHWDAVFNWSCTDEYPTNVLKLINQHKQ